MTTNHPTLQRTTPGMSQRKRLAAEAARKAKLVYPTTLQQPDAQDRVPTMSIADSALLQATLVQSRHAWTHTAFSRFIPEPPARGPGGKKYASDLTPVGLCTVCIGPHIFLDTKFYTVFNPTPPPPLSTSSTASNTAATTPTEESPHSPSPTSPVVLGGSPAPERVIELIMARTANMAAEAAAAGTVPETLAPSFMDIDIPATTAKAAETSCVDSKGDCPSEPNESKQASALTAAAPKEDDTNTTAPPKSEPAEKSITPTSSGTKVRLPPRQQRPKHQVAFEFKENPGVRWLFPHESSLELLPTESDEPARISASFYLPTLEEPRPGFAGTVTNPTLGLVPGPGQATTIVILEATAELWTGMQQSINDSAATYRFMMDKMKHIPPRAYVQYNLPITFPDEQLLVLGLRKLPDHKVVPIASLEPSKRTLDNQTESQPGIKAKRSKAGQDENMSVSSKVGGISRKSTTLGNSSSALAYQKQCVYCGCASTPMWRRGPDGSHTLCNACGVKWRHGRIYVNNNSKATTPSLTGNPSVPYTLSVSVPDALTTTAEAAVRMNQELYRTEDQEGGRSRYGLRSFTGHVRQDNIALAEGDAGGLKGGDGDKLASGKKRGAGKASTSAISGPKMVPIHQIGETMKQSGRTANSSRKEKEKVKDKDKEKTDESNNAAASTLQQTVKAGVSPSPQDALLKDGSDRLSANASPTSSSPVSASSATSTKLTASSASSGGSTPKIATSKTGATKAAGAKTTAAASKASKQKTSASSGATTPPTTKPSPPTSAAAKLSLLKSLASAPRYQVSHPAAVATMNLADDGLALYATKNLYTNNTATFPLHFPTISIAFGPNNAYYMYPNCAVVLFENHFQIKLIQAGERTDIDVWKEGIDGTEFQVVDVGDGESMIVMKATLRQHLTRFDMELLNPDKNETSIVFRFRERLDGGGPPVKPLLEQWLTTEIPVAVPPVAKPASS